MSFRLSLYVSRSIQTLLNRQISRSTSIVACKYNTIPVSGQRYVMNYDKFNIEFSKIMGQPYSSEATQIVVPIVSYEEVKDLQNHSEKFLIDVREPQELQETGIIPTSINIPRKIFFFCIYSFVGFFSYIQSFLFEFLTVGEVDAALNMSDRQFKTKYNRNKPDVTDEIIFHCKVGMRSENAAITAIKLGYIK